MDFLISIIYLFIFIVILVFIFSAGLLTPMIGKKNIVVVGILGFIIGVIGGGFLMVPIYQDLPYIVGSVHSVVDPNHEILKVSVSSKDDLNQSIRVIKDMKGFKSLKETGFKLTTTSFSKDRKNFIENHLSRKYGSYEVDSSGLITVFTNKEFNLNEVNNLSQWLSYTGAITINSSSIYFDVNVNANNVVENSKNFSNGHIVVESVKGPVQNTINFVKNTMVDEKYMLLITGMVGLLVALVGSFWDTILDFIRKIRGKL
ncbi:MAG: hypothetical protein LBC39_02095 [Methanobrevibacter sp.]|jgi:hypothetical protein|nr:hypothetical protein [Candidatus Methanovirga aequatorialis]